MKYVHGYQVPDTLEEMRAAGEAKYGFTEKPAWRAGDHLKPGYKPFQPSPETRKAVRQYIAAKKERMRPIALTEAAKSLPRSLQVAVGKTKHTIGKCNPTTKAELIAYVSEMLADQAGDVILQALRDADNYDGDERDYGRPTCKSHPKKCAVVMSVTGNRCCLEHNHVKRA